MKWAKGIPPKPPWPAGRGAAGVASNRCKTVAGEFTLSFPVESYLRFRGDGRFDTEAAIRAVFRLGMTHTSSDASGIRYCARKEWCFRTTGSRTPFGAEVFWQYLARKRRKRCVGQEF